MNRSLCPVKEYQQHVCNKEFLKILWKGRYRQNKGRNASDFVPQYPWNDGYRRNKGENTAGNKKNAEDMIESAIRKIKR